MGVLGFQYGHSLVLPLNIIEKGFLFFFWDSHGPLKMGVLGFQYGHFLGVLPLNMFKNGIFFSTSVLSVKNCRTNVRRMKGLL